MILEEMQKRIKIEILSIKGKIRPSKCSGELWKKIEETTEFLDKDASRVERIHCILSGFSKLQMCQYCGLNPVKFHAALKGYSETCSKKCAGLLQNNKKGLVIDFIRNLYDGEIIKNTKIPLELDIYLPEKNFGVEFNDTYQHSYNRKETKEERKSHLKKTEECEVLGIHLLQIFSHEWEDKKKRDIWKSIIRNKLGKNKEKIYGRKTKLKVIEKGDKNLRKEAKKFLDDNHLQGHVYSSMAIGLYYNDELVSLMTFGKSRFNKNYDFELVRFCSKKNTSVIGGARKIYKYFNSLVGINRIVSYADRRFSNGNLYEVLEMEKKKTSKPNYFYRSKNGEISSRVAFQKHKLEKKLEKFSEKLTESENMFINSFRRFWDCGNLVFGTKGERV